MNRLLNIYSNFTFYICLGFLFLINVSIAGCYILYTTLLLHAVGFVIFNRLNKFKKYAAGEIPVNDGGEFGFPELPGYYKCFLPYIVLTLISAVFAVDPVSSLKDGKKIFLYLLIPLFLLILNDKKRLKISLYTVWASATFAAIAGIVMVAVNGLSLDHRIKGFMSHWMTYSGLLMLAFVFFLVYLFHRFHDLGLKEKVILGTGLIIMLAAIALTQTRSIWVGIVVSLGIYGMTAIYSRPKLLRIAIPGVAVAGIIIALLLPAAVKTRIASIVDINDPSNKDRVYMVTLGMQIFKEHPLTGVGPTNVEKVYNIYKDKVNNRYKPEDSRPANPHLHNNFLQILAERGIFALLALIGLFVSIIYHLIRRIKGINTGTRFFGLNEPISFEKGICLGACFAFIAFVTAGFFEYNFEKTEIRFLLFYLLAIPFLYFSNSMNNGEAR